MSPEFRWIAMAARGGKRETVETGEKVLSSELKEKDGTGAVSQIGFGAAALG
jgi:hypothetical protein